MIWWLVIFATLPFGNRQPDENETGMAHGAPSNPNIKKKMIATSIISFVVLGILYTVIELNLIDFRGIAREMDANIYGDRNADTIK